MAKGRKLTTSRSERLLGSYSYGHSQGSIVTDSAELGEDDVWSTVDSVFDHEADNSSYGEWIPRATAESNGNMPISRRQIPPNDRNVGGLSLAFEESGKTTSSPRILYQFRGNDSVSSPRGQRHNFATSAPVNVPDWSKILRVDSVESLHELNDGVDDRDSEIVPPHEYVARSRKTAVTSVFEGVGRTLKGRDLSRVRDAVWSRTGFDG